METTDYQELRRTLTEQRLPAAVVDLNAFEANIATVLRRAGDRPIRVASKSVRSVSLLRRILDASPRFRGLLCYHALEACWLAEQGFEDLLVAYPTVNGPALEQVVAATREGHRITLMVDSPAHVERIEGVAAAAGVRLPLCLDIDMSLALPGLWFGVRRSPLRTQRQALALWRRIAASDHVYLDGVMGYEAQLAGLPDRVPGAPLRSRLIGMLKALSRRRVRRRRGAIVAALSRAGARLRFVNGGGSGSLESTAADPSVTEIAAGSAFYAPTSFDHHSGFGCRPAAGFALEVGRRPARGIVTCNGGGYVASGAPGSSRLPSPWLPAGLRLSPHEGAGEVQTPLTGAVELQVGDPVLFRHAKAGELCERFDELLLLRRGRIEATVPTYRGAGRNFL